MMRSATSGLLHEDRLEIISVGNLHFGPTPEALFREHESRPWNPMIAHTTSGSRPPTASTIF